ncbi:MAG: glycosyl hydrolase family 8, partial [bacterium]
MRLRLLKKSLFAFLLTGVSFLLYADVCNYPFPQNVDYPYGLKPTNYTDAEMNQHVQDWWEKWSAKYLTQEDCAPDEWRVIRHETGKSIHKDCQETDTVSEGIGYGMIVCVYMSSSTNNTKQYFDGMWNFYKNNMNENGLMNWQVPYCDSAGAATDADED